VTAIVVRICCCIPNFIKIGSRVRPSDAHNCWMSSAPLLGNGRCYGNRIMADMSKTWWDATSQLPSNWSIARGVMVFPIFSNMAAVRHFEFKKKINIWSRDCHCVPNFIEIGSRVQPPDAHNCRMFNASLLGNCRCHSNRIIMASWRTCWEHDGMWPPKLRHSRSIGRRVMAFRIFSNMAAVRHFEF